MKFKELPKKWKRHIIFLISISVIFFVLLVGFHMFLQNYRQTNQEIRSALVKADEQLLGERLSIGREGKNSIKVNIYYPTIDKNNKLPVVFNIHGGGFVGGDADVLDTQSQRLADQWQAVIITVNYTKADVKPISYGAEEIKDAVFFFAENASQFGIDPSKFTIMGYSAGAYYTATAANLLVKEDFNLAKVVLAYPWMTGLKSSDLEANYPQTLFVLAGKDQISQNAKPFIEDMEKAKNKVTVIEYQEAVHSFIESNNPEGLTASSGDLSEVINEKQENLARLAEMEIHKWIISD